MTIPATTGSDELSNRQAVTKLVTDMTVEKSISEEYLIDELLALITAKIAEAEIAAQLSEPNADWYKEQYRQAIIKFNKATELMESATEILRDSGAHLQRKQGGSKR